jgi:fructose-1,6-bisphosphatase
MVTGDSLSKADGRFSVAFNEISKYTAENQGNTMLLENPGTNNHFIIKSGGNYANLSWLLKDGNGRNLQAGNLYNVVTNQVNTINTIPLAAGIYYISINGDQHEIKTLKWIKQ